MDGWMDDGLGIKLCAHSLVCSRRSLLLGGDDLGLSGGSLLGLDWLGNGSSGLGRDSLGGSSLDGSSLDFSGDFVAVSVSLSLLDVLGEDLVVLGLVVLGLLEAGGLLSLFEGLSPESLFGDESLDLGGLVEGLVALLDFSPDYVLPHIVLLSEGEGLSDGGGSLGAEASGLVAVGHAFDFGVSLLGDAQGDDGEVGATDAASHGLSLSLSRSSRSVSSCLYFKTLR